MTAHTIEPAVDVAWSGIMQVGECPLWHPQERLLYWVDIDGRAVHRLNPADGGHRVWTMDSEPSALAHSAGGGLVVATRRGVVHLDTRTDAGAGDNDGDGDDHVDGAAVTDLVAAPYDTSRVRFNDGRADPAGRFWIGTIYEPRDRPAAEMYVLERGALRLAWSGGMTNSNGLAFSPDRRTMYHADTAAHRVTRYAYDVATGTVSAPQLFRQFDSDKTAPDYGGRPDGAAVDSAGNYWCALFEGARVLCLSPQGEVLHEIKLPARCPTMVTFGGADLRTLYITTASHNRPPAELAQYPHNGRVLQVRVAIAGQPEPAYQE
ncbi:SMP-30/gluconolactonase/LRE family protein [Rugamonas sp.]|uniref:SMP-30/gluconolactonase/LRE family protein n=1 Tax=Rugamonas sp. TaxID=1926287 RepID=UPI0025F3029E|nr:SMP-30/gluconolactonase/LRE family protein [Rugamonas sp.]